MRPANHQSRDVVDAQVVSASVNDRLIVTAWYDGEQTTGELPVTGFRLNWSADRRVHGQATLTIADPEGTLWPRAITDPLGVAGSRLQLSYRFGATGATIPLGLWRIRRTVPRPVFQYRRIGDSVAFIPGGGTIVVYADEELASLELDRLDPAERTPTHNTVLAEVAHLVSPYLTTITGLEDAPISAVEYDENRLTTIQRLLDQIGATYRMTGGGWLEIIPATGTPADWEIKPGESGTLVSLENTMDDRDLVNAVISHRTFRPEGADADITLVGRARIEEGPLAWGGPFGRVPTFRGANLAETQAAVDADATSTLARLEAAGDVHLSLETLAHPGLQVHDLVTLEAPRTPHAKPIAGRVQEVTLSSTGAVINKAMAITLAVSHAALDAINESS